MKKSTLTQSIKEMKSFAKKMPKSINEVMDFECNDLREDDEYDDEDMEEPMKPEESNASEKAAQLIDSIRKQALRAMAELADNPDDPNYIMLKKVWQMTDRKPEKEEKNPMM